MLLLSFLGCTNCGKTTAIDRLAAQFPTAITAIPVGRILRAKYPASHFQGQGAPASTVAEVEQIIRHGVEVAKLDQFPVVLLDGQPRDISQIHWLRGMDVTPHYLHLYLREAKREERALARDQDKDKRDLSLKRVRGDAADLYEVLARLQILAPEQITTVDVEHYDPVMTAWDIIRKQVPSAKLTDALKSDSAIRKAISKSWIG